MAQRTKKSDVPLLTPRSLAPVAGAYDWLESVQPLPGGDDVIVASFEGVRSVDAASGNVTRWYRKHAMMKHSVCWDPAVSANGAMVAAGFGSPSLFVWNKEKEVSIKMPSIATRATLTADGKTLAITRLSKEIVVFDAATLKERWRFEFKKSFANAARIDPAGKIIAAAGTDGFIRTFNAKTGDSLVTIKGSGWVNDLDLRAGVLATGGRGKEVRLYDVDGELLRVLPFGPNVERVSLSWDGKRVVASGGAKTSAMVWDVESGAPIGRLDPGEGVMAARFSCVNSRPAHEPTVRASGEQRAEQSEGTKYGPTGYRLAAAAGTSVATWDIP